MYGGDSNEQRCSELEFNFLHSCLAWLMYSVKSWVSSSMLAASASPSATRAINVDLTIFVETIMLFEADLFETEADDLFGFAVHDDHIKVPNSLYEAVVMETSDNVQNVDCFLDYLKIGSGTIFKSSSCISWKGIKEFVFPVESILEARQKSGCEISGEILDLIHLELVGHVSFQFSNNSTAFNRHRYC